MTQVEYSGGPVTLLIGDLPVAELAPDGPIDPETNRAGMKVTPLAWDRCRSRKRLIKLLMGVAGMPRNIAAEFARAAMDSGCPSYQELWMECRNWYMDALVRVAPLGDIVPYTVKEIYFNLTTEEPAHDHN